MTEPQYPNRFGAMPGQPGPRDNAAAPASPASHAPPHGGKPDPSPHGKTDHAATPGAPGSGAGRASHPPQPGTAGAAKPAQPPIDAPESDAAQSANDAEMLAQAQAELATLKAKTSDLADQYLRAKAEVDNARRRADEEVAKARKFAVEAFAESLLPVLDSLEAGLAIKEATVQQIREGTEATLRQLTAALERNKVLPVDPKPGEKFDPNRHHAISIAAPGAAAQPPNTVVGVLQKGYTIADRVLRPALVTVSAPA